MGEICYAYGLPDGEPIFYVLKYLELFKPDCNYNQLDYRDHACYYLGRSFLEIDDTSNAIKFFEMGCSFNDKDCLEELCKMYSSNIKIYKKLKSMEQTTAVIAKITELEQSKEILNYNKNIQLFDKLNNYHECNKCKCDNVLNILNANMEEICICCYE